MAERNIPYVDKQAITDRVRSTVAFTREALRSPELIAEGRRAKYQRKHHKSKKVAFFRYSYYDPAFKYFTEQVLDADYLSLPAPTKHTTELGAQYTSDYVCTPFKHMIGDYIEALELGANVLVQVCGPCRLGYYGEMQESILHDLGYEFSMLNFSENVEQGILGWAKDCLQVVNPDIGVPHAIRQLLAVANMALKLDEAQDYYLANAGFTRRPGAMKPVWNAFLDEMRAATTSKDVRAAFAAGMEAMADVPADKPEDPIRIGVVGDMFTAIDQRSNLDIDDKLIQMGVEVHRMMNLTNRFIRYNEPELRKKAAGYITYDMGPTSTITIVAAHEYAAAGFDGVIHAKASCCTPEIDCMPVLARISADYQMPVLYLTYDSQTSDTGLNTRLEAFYDMLAMKKEALR